MLLFYSDDRFFASQERKKLSFSSMVRLSFVQPLSLTSFDSSPGRGASGETVHFAGTAKASPTRSNGDDRRQWRKQGGAVGAAASRMRAAAKQTLGAATRAVSPKVTERVRMLEGRLLLFRAGHGILEKKNPPTRREKGETEI